MQAIYKTKMCNFEVKKAGNKSGETFWFQIVIHKNFLKLWL